MAAISKPIARYLVRLGTELHSESLLLEKPLCRALVGPNLYCYMIGKSLGCSFQRGQASE
jgi:hypothetical protein